MTAVAIGILALYMMNLLIVIIAVKSEKRIDRLESSERTLRVRIWDLEHKKEGEQNAAD